MKDEGMEEEQELEVERKEDKSVQLSERKIQINLLAANYGRLSVWFPF